jgi:hypothetical protein
VSECRGFAHEPRPLLHMRCSASASPNCPSGNDDEYSGTNRETDARCRFRSGRLRPPPKVPRLRAFSECGEREVWRFRGYFCLRPRRRLQERRRRAASGPAPRSRALRALCFLRRRGASRSGGFADRGNRVCADAQRRGLAQRRRRRSFELRFRWGLAGSSAACVRVS